MLKKHYEGVRVMVNIADWKKLKLKLIRQGRSLSEFVRTCVEAELGSKPTNK